MKEKTRAVWKIGAAFLLLTAVSLYRQLSLRFLPSDPARPFIVYAVYILLMGYWQYSLRSRITQKSMLLFLHLEGFIMFFWLTVRLLQDAFFYKDVHIMRMSGYLIGVPLTLIPLLGFYSALCLGRDLSYKLPHAWYFALIPTVTAGGLIVTNELHFIMIRILPGEEENLYFHPNYGLILPIALAVFFIVGRMCIIYRRTRLIEMNLRYKVLPLIIGICMPLTLMLYLVQGFVVTVEVIEMTAKLYFLEALSWEMCILIGLVPVNSQYSMVFEQSSVGMRIVDNEGKTLISSSHARPLPETVFSELKQKTMLSDPSGYELHLHRLQDGYLVYHKDVLQIYTVIRELNQTAAELEQEGALLNEELRTRSVEAAVSAQNAIYDRLSAEVGRYLEMMQAMLRNADGSDRETLIRKLCLIGTYVKRRCNLRLIEQENGSIDKEELCLSLTDLVMCLKMTGADAELIWEPAGEYAAEESLSMFDAVAAELEKCDFAPRQFRIIVRDGLTMQVTAP